MLTEIPVDSNKPEARKRGVRLWNSLTRTFWFWLLFFPPLVLVMLMVGWLIVMILAAD